MKIRLMGDALLNQASEHWRKDQSVMKRFATPPAALMLSSAPVMTSTVEIITPLPFAPNTEAFLKYMSGTYEGLEVAFFEAKNCRHPKDFLVPGAIKENAYACEGLTTELLALWGQKFAG